MISIFIATAFLSDVGKHDAARFFSFTGSTVVCFIAAAFLLQGTKGRTLEENEGYFEAEK